MRVPFFQLALVPPVLAVLCSSCDRAPGTPPARDEEAASAAPDLFREITNDAGLTFRHQVTVGGRYALPELLGGGVAVFDANGDGLLDLFFVDTGETKGRGAPDRLYLRTADGRYRDATAGAGLDRSGYGTGVAAGDVDNDGDVDLYVGNWGPDALYLNDGGGRFTDVTERAGIRGDHWTSSIAFLDYDLDGFLDIFVVHYVKFDPERTCSSPSGRPDYCGPEVFDGVADTLYRNRGDGTFEDVSARAGIATVARNGLGVVVEDFNDDGWPDVYVANDGQANDLWINRKDGRFSNEALAMGLAVNGAGAAQASMGIAVGDVEGDGDLDVFITNITNESHILYTRSDRFGFVDHTAAAGITAPTRSHTAFGAVMFDADLDGDLDLAVANGRVLRIVPPHPRANVDAHWNGYADANQLFLNGGRGAFVEGGAGAFAAPVEVFRALAAVDLDGDGDLDLVTTGVGAPARVFENVHAGGHWLKVRVRDEKLKRDVYGARVIVRDRGATRQRTVQSAVSYLTSCATPVHFGLGSADSVEGIEVVWPGGGVERFDGTPANRELTLLKGSGRP